MTSTGVVGTFFDNLEALNIERSVNNLLLDGWDVDFGTKSNKIAGCRQRQRSIHGFPSRPF